MRKNTCQENKMLEEIYKVNPSLRELRKKAEIMLRDNHAVDFWHKYESLKSEINSSVGFFAPDNYPDWMKTSTAHEVMFREVFNGLV